MHTNPRSSYQYSKPNTTLNRYDIMDGSTSNNFFFMIFAVQKQKITLNLSRFAPWIRIIPRPLWFNKKKGYTKYQISIHDYIFMQLEHSHFPTCIDSQPPVVLSSDLSVIFCIHKSQRKAKRNEILGFNLLSTTYFKNLHKNEILSIKTQTHLINSPIYSKKMKKSKLSDNRT